MSYWYGAKQVEVKAFDCWKVSITITFIIYTFHLILYLGLILSYFLASFLDFFSRDLSCNLWRSALGIQGQATDDAGAFFDLCEFYAGRRSYLYSDVSFHRFHPMIWKMQFPDGKPLLQGKRQCLLFRKCWTWMCHGVTRTVRGGQHGQSQIFGRTQERGAGAF